MEPDGRAPATSRAWDASGWSSAQGVGNSSAAATTCPRPRVLHEAERAQRAGSLRQRLADHPLNLRAVAAPPAAARQRGRDDKRGVIQPYHRRCWRDRRRTGHVADVVRGANGGDIRHASLPVWKRCMRTIVRLRPWITTQARFWSLSTSSQRAGPFSGDTEPSRQTSCSTSQAAISPSGRPACSHGSGQPSQTAESVAPLHQSDRAPTPPAT